MPAIERFIYKYTKHIIAITLIIMFLLGILSMKDDALTRDELAHIPAGYSYLEYSEIRLNPEHPPIVKDIAAFPLVFMNPNFPDDDPAWENEPNPQWDLGYKFIFASDNDADLLILAARIPILLFTILGGLLVYYIGFKIGKTKNRFTGRLVGLLSLVFYAFSPNILAHGRLVTTDVVVSLGILLSLYSFAQYILKPTKKRLLLAIVAFAFAQLAKFSAIVVIPIFFFAIIALALSKTKQNESKEKTTFIKIFWPYFIRTISIILLGYIIISLFYLIQTSNMSTDRVHDLINYSILPEKEDEPFKNFLNSLVDLPGGKALALYCMGFMMVFGRVVIGHTTYFLGKFSATGWWYFFPVIFLLKIPLSILILLISSFYLKTKDIIKSYRKRNSSISFWKRIMLYCQDHFIEMTFVSFIVAYWLISLTSSLNLGFRHILPTIPLMLILLAKFMVNYITNSSNGIKSTIREKTIVIGLFGAALVWYIGANLYTFPNYISYYNELIGSQSNGYKIAVDSNSDWGQDLRRLANWVNSQENIQSIKIHYFGGADPAYYLGDKYEEWDYSEERPTGWFAISASALQHSKKRSSELHYDYLEEIEPVITIGRSIFVYHFPEG